MRPGLRRYWLICVRTLLVLAALALGPRSSLAQSLYGISQLGNQLITLDTASGAGTLVGTTSINIRAFGLAFRGSKLYAWDANALLLRELNPATAAIVSSMDINSTAFGEGDITFRSDGIGFLSAVAPSRLVRFDITIPNSALIAPLVPTMDGLAFNAAGVLYGLAEGGQQLFTIDPLTGAATLVGNTGVSAAATGNGGLAFDAGGKLFAVLTNGAGSPATLYQLDPSTAAATLIGPVGFNGICGLAFAPPPPPSPSPPTPPPPRPTGIEGSYPGCAGPFGPEGAFGMGARSRAIIPANKRPMLHGPFPSSVGAKPGRSSASVFHTFPEQAWAATTNAGDGVDDIIWATGVLAVLAALATALCISARKRVG